jgi:signal transduction histidine kinase
VTGEIIQRQRRIVLDTTLLRQLYDAVTEIVIILNRQRQIVFYNKRLPESFGMIDRDGLYGLRPGEALNCQHAFESPGGCGTTEFCRTCGAVAAILSSQAEKADVKECRILRRNGGGALDLLVRATPLTLDGELYTLFAVTDISHEKRRQALERVFFHDLMNTAAALRISLGLLGKAGPEQMDKVKDQIERGVSFLLEQVRSQRDLAAAENLELAVHRTELTSGALLQGLIESWRLYEKTRACPVELQPDWANIRFTSDPTLLSRILTNMVKNAVEASPKGARVTVACVQADDGVEFRVHNAGVMAPDVQAQIFQRSFSTKGIGRGLGAYSMKLLGERYLKAEISFTSSQAEGTVFRIRCPLAI